MIEKTKTYYYIIPLIILCFVYIIKSFFFPIHDFGNYYFGGYFLKEGIFNTDLYFPYVFNKTIFDLGYENLFLSFAPNTPFLALFFSPFSLLSITTSKLAFNIISSCLFFFSIYRLCIFFNIKKEYLLLIPIVFFIPIKNNLLFGQIYFLLFFLLAEGFISYKKKAYINMSVLWSIAILLKVFPVFIFGFLLFKQKYKAVLYLSVSCLLFLIISILTTRFSTWEFYISNVLLRANNGEIAGAFVDNYQSLFMFLKRLFVYDVIENKSVVYDNYIVFKSLIAITKISVIGLLFYFTKQNKKTFLIFSIWFLASTLISPYGSTYGFLLLIFFFLAICLINISKKKKVIVFCMLFLISNISIYKTTFFPFNYSRLFLIVSLFIIIIYYLRKNILLKQFSLILFLSILTVPFLANNLSSTKSVLHYKTPLLTYDYTIKNDTLSYCFWDNSGKNEVKEFYKYSSIDSTQVSINENQVFYKEKQLTFNISNKQKPIICDNKILFLCDKNRGIGFYNIISINIKDE